MLTRISEKDMFSFLREIYPFADRNALAALSKEKIATIDSRLEDTIFIYCTQKKPTEFEYEEFSLSLIMQLKKCKFPLAVLLMNEYLKDRSAGKAIILKR